MSGQTLSSLLVGGIGRHVARRGLADGHRVHVQTDGQAPRRLAPRP
ncbi:hypothetical protein [Microbacterium mangrovi]|nr:hypothetical protein [Microbacterium mangrovi]